MLSQETLHLNSQRYLLVNRSSTHMSPTGSHLHCFAKPLICKEDNQPNTLITSSPGKWLLPHITCTTTATHTSQDHHPQRLCLTLLECTTRHMAWWPDMKVMTKRTSLPSRTHLPWVLCQMNTWYQRETINLPMNNIKTLAAPWLTIRTVPPT